MRDEKREPVPNREEPVPDPRLAARLLARAQDSAGLIDVRGAEQHYERIMDWLAARTPLLERLRTRYGLVEGDGINGLVFAEAWGREGLHAGAAELNLSAAPSGLDVPAVEQIVTRVARIPADPTPEPTELKRIARRGVPTFSPAPSEPGTKREREEAVRYEQVEVFRPVPEPTLTNRGQARELQSPSPAREVPAANPAQGSTAPPARRALRTFEERAAPPLARGVAPSVEASKPNPARPYETNAAAVIHNTSGTNAPRVNESPRTNVLPPMPNSTAQLRARDSAPFEEMPLEQGAPEGRKASSNLNAGLPVTAETPRPLAHAMEICAPDPVRASPSLHAQTPLPLALNSTTPERSEAPRGQKEAGPAVTRTSASAAPETFTPAQPRTPARADEIDVQRLAEQVSRHLERKLLVERERRGWRRR